MESLLLLLELASWSGAAAQEAWIAALEGGKVLFFPKLAFELKEAELPMLTPAVLAEGSRNISLGADGALKGAAGDAATQAVVGGMIGRFREQSQQLIHSLLPQYAPHLRVAPTSFRPMQVETRSQSWRADDRRLHVDAFPSRPNRGERILRVFANVNPEGVPRTWRLGEPFEQVARHFLPRAKPYRPWQAKALNAVGVTKSLRSEYDHLMLQLHDAMKADAGYQQGAQQQVVPFPPGSVWICFSDQAAHAVQSGQYMLEQTLHLPVAKQYNPESSPLAILSRLTGRPLV